MEDGIHSDVTVCSDGDDITRGASSNSELETISRSVIVADHLALIEANQKALMLTITRTSCLILSSILACGVLFAHYYFLAHGKPEPIVPDWAMGLILSTFSCEFYVGIKNRLGKNPDNTVLSPR